MRQQALNIAEQGRKIVALDQQLLDVWRMLNHAVAYSEQRLPLLEVEAMLNHAVAFSEQRLPLLEVEAEKAKADIEKERKREKELTEEYEKEKDSLNQELGANRK